MLNKPFLYELLKTPSPSGYELTIQKKIMQEMKASVDQVMTHHNYNVIQVINPLSPIKILLSGHIDEIGLCINEILKDGTCKMEKIGGIRPYMYAGQHVQVIHHLGQIVDGVIGYLPNMDEGKLKVSDLVLDLGTASQAETEKIIAIGDAVVHKNDYVELNNNKLSARALDNKLGAFIVLEALKEAKENGAKSGVYASTTVGEETTGRGAMAAADMVQPTCAIVVDVTYAADLKYRENLTGTVALGKGPALARGSLMNKKLEMLAQMCAEKLGIAVQYEIAPARTFTDADDIYQRQMGIPTYLISIPLRYMHSSVEVCDYQDVEDIIHLLAHMICSIDESTTFSVFENDGTD